MIRKITALILAVSLIITQPVFAQGVGELNIGKYLNQMPVVKVDSFRPARLRYVSYDIKADSFQLLLDKGDAFNQRTEEPKNQRTLELPNSLTPKLQDATQELFNYFLIGLSLPNEKFWVNLRPDAPEQIIDPLLEKTDMGKIMLEADLQLKKDTAGLTSPQNPEGKEYWDKLYKKAGELFGTENITIPTITRPWIVPGEVIIRESEDSAYIYKANLKVMLEEDYLRGTKEDGRGTIIDYSFNDPRLKELNKYSTELIKELILPRLTQEINTSKKYAQLRQVFFSLILSRWFKDKYKGKPGQYSSLIDSRNLDKLGSQDPWSKEYYFSEYKKSFEQGEYNLKAQVLSIYGQSVRSYVSGGIQPVPKDISSFRSVGANSPIDLNVLIPIVTSIAIAGGIYTIIRLQASNIDALHQEEFRKLKVIRDNIVNILFFAEGKLLAYDDAVVVKEELSNYYIFRSEETVTAVKRTIEALKSFAKLSNETQQKNREQVIAILEQSLQTLDKVTGSSPLTQQEKADMIFAEGIAKEFKQALVKYRKRIEEINYPNSVFDLFPDIEEDMYVKNTRNIVVIDFDRVYEVLKEVYISLHSTLTVMDFPSEQSEILVEFRDAVSDLKKKMSKYGSSPLTQKEAKKGLNEYLDNLDRNYGDNSSADRRIKTYWAEISPEYWFYVNYIVNDEQDLRVMETKINKLERMVKTIEDTVGPVEFVTDLNKLLDSIKVWIDVTEKEFNLREEETSSSLTEALPQTVDPSLAPGGIDFTQINYFTRPMGSFQGLDLRLPILSKTELEGMDINKELASVEQMVNAKIDVSTDRLKRLLAAMSQKDAFTSQRETQLLPLLLRLCWLKEEKGTETTPDFRAVLLIADTGLFVEQVNAKYSLN